MIVSVLIAIIAASILVSIILLLKGVKSTNKKDVSERIQKKGRSAILKEAQKKLSHDPHNVNALETLGDLHFQEKNWEKVWSIYKTLFDISAAHVEVDVGKTALRMGIAAFQLDKLSDAQTSLVTAIKKNPEDFDCNFYLGQVLYQTGVYDKAVYCLKKAGAKNPENPKVIALLAESLFKMQKYRDALPFLKRALDEAPDNKEILYDMAVSMLECGYNDKALKVFMHLRPDPLFGPQACLEAGKMHERSKSFDLAIKDYEIALKLPSVPDEIMIQIKYRMGNTYIALNDISKGLTYLKQIQAMKQGYKDVDILVARYSELNQNKNLQTYLMSGTSDFVALCRKFIATYYKDAFVKVEDVQVLQECVEIICDVEHPKFSAKQMFRFYRNQNTIGDIFVREFHSKLRDHKCDSGICVTVGSYTDSAHKYIEGRPVDLIEKEQLVKILKKISMFN